MIIDGYTQPGASPNTNPPGLGSNAVLKIVLDGSNAPGEEGVRITAGTSTVRGLVINRFGYPQQDSAITLAENGGHVEGNFIGIDSGGGDGDNGGNGVYIWNSSGNTIGGSSASERNVISGNGGAGVVISGGGTGNTVKGNYIGTDAAGTATFPSTARGVVI